MAILSIFRAVALGAVLTFAGCSETVNEHGQRGDTMTDQDPMTISEEQWRERLTPEQYKILRKKGTERAGSGPYHDLKAAGAFHCAGCGAELFRSEAKFDSGTGWPSFWQPAGEASVATEPDNSLFSKRTEVLCRRCGGHLGHVFDDGPQPTGQRYCINSAALKFEPEE